MKNNLLKFSACLVTLGLATFGNILRADALIPQSDKDILSSLGAGIITSNSVSLNNATSRLESSGAKAYITWKYLTNPNSNPSLQEILTFVRDNPDWPRMQIVRIKLENLILDTQTTDTIIKYFKANPPIGFNAKKKYAAVLIGTGDTNNYNIGRDFIRNIWNNELLMPSEQHSIMNEFSSILTPQDYYQRMQFLLGKQYISQIQSFVRYLSPAAKQELSLRTALIRLSPSALSQYENASETLKNHLGVKRDLVFYYRKTARDNMAINVLANSDVPLTPLEGEFGYDNRNVMSRVAFKNNRPDLSYQIISKTGLATGANFVDAQWYAGWLALRHLNQPAVALKHFQAALSQSTMPISMARGAYWTGRAYIAMGNKVAAESAYKQASQYFYTYYGQLALYELGINTYNMPNDPVVSDNVRQIYNDNNLIQSAYAAVNAGYPADAKAILLHVANRKSLSPQVYPLLSQTAQQLGFPEIGLKIGKAASAKNVFLQNITYPMIRAFDGYKSSSYISVYRALTRQESEYDQYAKSHVGASGLMQLMPATARMTARKMGKPYCEPCLVNNPAYNISLGTYFLRGLLDNFSGSYVKALAGYNAGPGRISQWTASYGTHTDNLYQMIDWVETIPFSETRNYVQRIIESVQIYRASEKNSKILQVQTADDIRRGV